MSQKQEKPKNYKIIRSKLNEKEAEQEIKKFKKDKK